MTLRFGNKIVQALKVFKSDEVKEYPEAGKFVVVTHQVIAEITITERELGIEVSSVRNEQLIYFIDNDLYPLNDKKYDDIHNEIEADIVSCIQSIYQHQILFGLSKGKPAMVIPINGKLTMVAQRRFRTLTMHTYLSKAELVKSGEFVFDK